MKVWNHFCTITKHKIYVMKYCFKVGLYQQGILHDLSKYGPKEFLVGCKYYKGYMSPNNAERADKGCSYAWLHHKGRNKHHFEYWIDYCLNSASGEKPFPMEGMKMPIRYVVEMFIDRVSASKNYLGENYQDKSALEYYENGKVAYLIHEDTRALLEYLLVMLAQKGEKYTFSFIKNEVLKGKIPYQSIELKRRKDALHISR